MNDTSMPDNGVQCLVDFDLYRRAMSCVSTEATRYYITGVCIEPIEGGGALLIAMDGTALVAFRDPKGVVRGAQSVIVRLDANTLRPGMKAQAISGRQKILAVAGDKASVVFANTDRDADAESAAINMALRPDARVPAHQWAGAVVAGTYPDWRRVVPKADLSPVAGSVDVTKLQKIALALTGKSSTPIFRAWQLGTATCPILVRTQGVDGFGIVMPHSGRVDAALPDWFGEPR